MNDENLAFVYEVQDKRHGQYVKTLEQQAIDLGLITIAPPPIKKILSPTVETDLAKVVNSAVGKTHVRASSNGNPAGYRVSVSPSIPMPGNADRDWTVRIELEDGYAWPSDIASPTWSISGKVATRVIRTDAVKPHPRKPDWVSNHILYSRWFAIGSAVLGAILLTWLTDGWRQGLGYIVIPAILITYIWFDHEFDTP